MRALGKFLQLLGLFALPIGMLLELSQALGRSFGLNELLLVLVFGVVAFFLGRLLEGYAKA